jgi:hypothetical protein
MLSLVAICVSAQAPTEPVSISISAPVLIVTIGSPVRLDITVTNNTNAIQFLPNSRIGPEDAGMVVLKSDGARLQPRDSERRTPGGRISMPKEMFPPKRSVTYALNIARWFDLSVPGQYSIQVKQRVSGSNLDVQSNRVVVTIIPQS